MRVERQNAFPSGALRRARRRRLLFSEGHGPPHDDDVAARAQRGAAARWCAQLGGLGKLPDAPPGDADRSCRGRARGTSTSWSSAAGRPGSAAATERARGGKKTLLVDEQDRVGGSLLAHPQHGVRAANEALAAALKAGVEVLSSSTALAWYPEDVATAGARAGAARGAHARGALEGRPPTRYVYATGALRSERACSPTTIARACCRRARSGGCSCASASSRRSARSSSATGRTRARSADALDAIGRRGHARRRHRGADRRRARARLGALAWRRRKRRKKIKLRPRRGGGAARAGLRAAAPARRRRRASSTRRAASPASSTTTGAARVPHVFACGDVTGFGGIDDAVVGGRALRARRRRQLQRQRRRGSRRMSTKALICRCEDVTLADVQHTISLGYKSIEEVKRYTGLGTGPCEGKECMVALRAHGARCANGGDESVRAAVHLAPAGAAGAARHLRARRRGRRRREARLRRRHPADARRRRKAKCDVAIVGGGVMGLGIAYQLAKRGIKRRRRPRARLSRAGRLGPQRRRRAHAVVDRAERAPHAAVDRAVQAASRRRSASTSGSARAATCSSPSTSASARSWSATSSCRTAAACRRAC